MIRTRRSGTVVRALERGVEQQTEALHRRQPAGGDDERASGDASPPGVKNSSTPLSTAVTRSGPEAEAEQLARASPPTA